LWLARLILVVPVVVWALAEFVLLVMVVHNSRKQSLRLDFLFGSRGIVSYQSIIHKISDLAIQQNFFIKY
jgi:hypothetical protein